jgi:hypothetical protein
VLGPGLTLALTISVLAISTSRARATVGLPYGENAVNMLMLFAHEGRRPSSRSVGASPR